MNGGTIIGFTTTDQTCLTNAAFSQASFACNTTAPILSVTDGSHAASIHLGRISNPLGLSLVADQGGGTMLHYGSS